MTISPSIKFKFTVSLQKGRHFFLSYPVFKAKNLSNREYGNPELRTTGRPLTTTRIDRRS